MNTTSINNLCKLALCISAILISLSLFIFSIRTNSANARETKKIDINDHATGVHLVGAGKHIYEVKWNEVSLDYDFNPIYTDH